MVNTAFKTRASSIYLNKFAPGYRTKSFIEDSYKVFQRNMRDIIFVVLISLRMATLLLTVLSKKHLNSVLQLYLTARIWKKKVTPQVTEAHYLWLQPIIGYHSRTPQSFSGKWDTTVQGKHDCWTECSGPEFCLPFVKIVNRPGNKPWVSRKYLRIPSNDQGYTPGNRNIIIIEFGTSNHIYWWQYKI